MKRLEIECFPVYHLADSQLEEKIRTDGYTHMIVNALETRWPRHKDLISAFNDHTAEYLIPGGTEWKPINPA